jgi:hypothetical protein
MRGRARDAGISCLSHRPYTRCLPCHPPAQRERPERKAAAKCEAEEHASQAAAKAESQRLERNVAAKHEALDCQFWRCVYSYEKARALAKFEVIVLIPPS